MTSATLSPESRDSDGLLPEYLNIADVQHSQPGLSFPAVTKGRLQLAEQSDGASQPRGIESIQFMDLGDGVDEDVVGISTVEFVEDGYSSLYHYPPLDDTSDCSPYYEQHESQHWYSVPS